MAKVWATIIWLAATPTFGRQQLMGRFVESDGRSFLGARVGIREWSLGFTVENLVVVSFGGSSGWTDSLIEMGRDADLLIAKAYWCERKVRFHLDCATLRLKMLLLGAKRLVLSHMSPDLLRRVSDLRDREAANNQLEIEII